MRPTVFVVAACACLLCAGCAPQPGQPDLPTMAREMTGEFLTFTVDVKDEIADRISEGTSAITGRP